MALPVGAVPGERSPSSHERPDLGSIEVDLLLEGIHQHYGFDFRNYARAPLQRGIQNAMTAEAVTTVSGLQERVLHVPASMNRFLGCVGVHVTSFFREPEMFAALRGEVFPLLRTYPSIRVWIAGCATGEEAYSMAVLLDEASMLDRCRLYATDMNPEALRHGRRGAYPAAALESARSRYVSSGGQGELAAHTTVSGHTATFSPRLRSRVTWAEHNLVTDASFNDFHLVVCANVLIYFDRGLQRQVHRLLDESVIPGGFLAVSSRETLVASPVRNRYQRVVAGASVFHRVRS